MTSFALLLSGASGNLGQRVLELLLAGPTAKNLIATTRSPDKLKDFAAKGVEVRHADFDSPDLARAFEGATRALLISTDALEEPGRRLAQHRAAIKAFESAGVKHVVYTSLTNPHPESPITLAVDHRETEAALARSSLEFTILRNNVYQEQLFYALPNAIASGKLVDACADGRVSFVGRDDCARAAAAALSSEYSGRRTLEITGPEALSRKEVAAMVSELSGREVTHVSVPADVRRASLLEHGLSARMADVVASFDVAIARGDLAGVSTAVRDLTGRAPETLREFLSKQRLAV